MAGSSTTFTYDDIGRIRKVTMAWVSDDTTGAVTGTSKKITGRLIKAVTIPSGSAAPSDNYDIAITNSDSVNVLGNVETTLADRSTSATQEVYFLIKDGAGTPQARALNPVVCSTLAIAVTNAGNSKEGTVILYYENEGDK